MRTARDDCHFAQQNGYRIRSGTLTSEKFSVPQTLARGNKPFDNPNIDSHCLNSFFPPMLASKIAPPPIADATSAAILQFPTEAKRAVRSLRHMTTQLLQEAAQVIPSQQLLINVVSRRVRQLGLGHRPLVEATPRSSLTDIALREIIDGKLTFEKVEETVDAA